MPQGPLKKKHGAHHITSPADSAKKLRTSADSASNAMDRHIAKKRGGSLVGYEDGSAQMEYPVTKHNMKQDSLARNAAKTSVQLRSSADSIDRAHRKKNR